MASATPAAFAPRHSTSALKARIRQQLRRVAEGSLVAGTVREAHDLPPRFLHGSSDGRIHALGRFHIGGAAYFVWALPPTVGGTAQRYVQVHSHTASSITTSKPLLLQGYGARFMTLALPTPPWGVPNTSGKRHAWTPLSYRVPHSGRRGDRNPLSLVFHYAIPDTL